MNGYIVPRVYLDALKMLNDYNYNQKQTLTFLKSQNQIYSAPKLQKIVFFMLLHVCQNTENMVSIKMD